MPVNPPQGRACTGVPTRLLTDSPEIRALVGWEVRDPDGLCRTFDFADYAATRVFVNAVADLAEAENHHPELVFGYNRCEVRWSTHDVGGVSTFDVICALQTEILQRTQIA